MRPRQPLAESVLVSYDRRSATSYHSKLCPQCCHNDFNFEHGRLPGQFYIFVRPEGVSIHLCPGSHNYVLYHHSERLHSADVLQSKTIFISPYSVFIGHAHMQHAGFGWLNEVFKKKRLLFGCRIRYLTCHMPRNHLFCDAMFYAYDWFYRIGAGLRPSDEQILHDQHDSRESSDRNIVCYSPVYGTVRLEE